MSAEHEKTYWAVLIGINVYQNVKCNDLRGCVQDVDDIEKLLLSHFENIPIHITKIIGEGQNESGYPDYPTVIAALADVKAKAKRGDFVYIHFSGHGARQEASRDSEHPQQSSSGGTYEVLLLDGSKHLKDYELGQHLDNLADDGMILFVVLDCCHSGGADRTGDGIFRELDAVLPADTECDDMSPRTQVGETLAHPVSMTRDASSQTCYWQKARNYTLFAACQPSQKAHEITVRGKHNGVLTHWLIKSLDQLSSGGGMPTYRALHQDILANMLVDYPSQSCMLFGEMDRFWLGEGSLQDTKVGVIKEIREFRVDINIGEVYGAQVGDEYEVYKRGAFIHRNHKIATIKVDEVEALQSSAKRPVTGHPLQVGCPVKLLTPVIADPLHVKVQSAELLQSLGEEMAQKGARVGLVLHPFDGNDWPYQVLSQEGYYEIADTTGTPIRHCPSMSANEEAARRIHRTLQNLARYRTVTMLYNKKSQLNQSFSFRVSGGDNVEVFHGDRIELEFENLTRGTDARPLYFTLFDLTPTWVAKQLTRPHFEIQPGVDKRRTTKLKMTVPVGAEDAEIQDILVVVVTTSPVSLEGLAAGSERSSGDDDMQGHVKVLQNLRDGWRPGLRNGDLDDDQDWQTRKIVITTRRLKSDKDVSNSRP